MVGSRVYRGSLQASIECSTDGRSRSDALTSPAMEFGPYNVTVDRHQVRVFRNDALVGTGRWTGTSIEDFDSPLDLDVGSDDSAVLAELAQALQQEELTFITAINANAYNSDGVDLTLIDWILAMSPRERFDVLETYTAIPYRQILGVLAKHQVEFVIVGGVAAHFYGASYMTKDMDVVYGRSPENIRRSLLALDEMNTIFRDFAGRRIAPNASYLASPNPKLLLTKYGPLDMRGTLSMEDDDSGYASLIDDATVVQLDEYTVHVLSLPRLIAVKERLKRPHDVAVLPLLRAALERANSSRP